jgi:UDP-3-O-acyl-N-acetylglucosamine deacetylase
MVSLKIRVTSDMQVQQGDAFVCFAPGAFAKITAGVDHQDEAPIIGQQWYSWRYTQDLHFRWG